MTCESLKHTHKPSTMPPVHQILSALLVLQEYIFSRCLLWLVSQETIEIYILCRLHPTTSKRERKREMTTFLWSQALVQRKGETTFMITSLKHRGCVPWRGVKTPKIDRVSKSSVFLSLKMNGTFRNRRYWLMTRILDIRKSRVRFFFLEVSVSFDRCRLLTSLKYSYAS